MKLILNTPKPRNPLVVPSMRRAAGSHAAGSGTRRQHARRELQRELQHLKRSP
jgi:hypothetical protein